MPPIPVTFGGDNWDGVREKRKAYENRDPTVLVVGGAQAGLSAAARLNQLGVDTLVVEKWPRIGDSWRKRYHSLALHNSIHVNNLPYLPFPPTWPNYIPKDMLGLWFEVLCPGDGNQSLDQYRVHQGRMG